MNVHYRNVKLTFFSHFHHVRALSKLEIDIFSHFHHVRALSICEIDIISHFHHVHALSQREIDIFQSFSPCACIIKMLIWHFFVISTMNVHYWDVKLTFCSHFHHLRALSRHETDVISYFHWSPLPIPNSDFNKTQHIENSQQFWTFITITTLHGTSIMDEVAHRGGGWLRSTWFVMLSDAQRVVWRHKCICEVRVYQSFPPRAFTAEMQIWPFFSRFHHMNSIPERKVNVFKVFPPSAKR